MKRLLRNRYIRAALIALLILALTPVIPARVLGLEPRQLPMRQAADMQADAP